MWNTIGHERAVTHLKLGLEKGQLSHAYLLTGPRQVGKMSLAMDLARALNCLGDERPCGVCDQCGRIERGLHADVRIAGVEAGTSRGGGSRTSIGIDQVREVQREASLKPYEGRYRVFVVDGAEHVTSEAANSLLKTLEEPPDQVVIALLAPDVDVLPPTVVSRCQRLDLSPTTSAVLRSSLMASRTIGVAAPASSTPVPAWGSHCAPSGRRSHGPPVAPATRPPRPSRPPP